MRRCRGATPQFLRRYIQSGGELFGGLQALFGILAQGPQN
jgi:hypothetical protein